MQNKSIKLIIAGGGTGGHLFPAFAIADTLKKRISDSAIHFVGSKFGIEADKFKSREESFTLLNIRGFGRGLSITSLIRNILFPLRFMGSYIKTRRLLRTFSPDIVIGTGGYASGLPILGAIHKGIPTLIHEQNSFPGFTTRWLASRVYRVCISYHDTERYLKKKISFSREIQSARNYR
ncbi:MAG: glycosyltransferase [Candidatus Marinimicrobia bacterium]|nr:glycosyltransferase [Candidatus Neomarinimicrobiota bacterium]MBL7046103.1 glycosyltransferase [Candidatus Neomarinimicrobiota bacterium]